MILTPEKKKVLALSLVRTEIICPKCNVEMKATAILGISLEKCPSCEGMFFDKGEAELLVRRHLREVRHFAGRLLGWLSNSRRAN